MRETIKFMLCWLITTKPLYGDLSHIKMQNEKCPWSLSRLFSSDNFLASKFNKRARWVYLFENQFWNQKNQTRKTTFIYGVNLYCGIVVKTCNFTMISWSFGGRSAWIRWKPFVNGQCIQRLAITSGYWFISLFFTIKEVIKWFSRWGCNLMDRSPWLIQLTTLSI